MASATSRHSVRFSDNNFTWLHDWTQALTSFSNDLRHFTLGEPTLRRFPFGFHSSYGLACNVTWLFSQSLPNPSSFPSAYSLRNWFLLGLFPEISAVDLFGPSDFEYWASEGSCWWRSVISGKCPSCRSGQVSDQYSSTEFTLELKIQILFFMLRSAVDLHTDLRVMKSYLAFPILSLTSSCVPPVVETMLPRKVKDVVSFRFLPFILIDVWCCFVAIVGQGSSLPLFSLCSPVILSLMLLPPTCCFSLAYIPSIFPGLLKKHWLCHIA